MYSLFDFLLSVHRAIWFPVYAMLGLEAQGVELPVELAPKIAAGDLDEVRPIVRRGKRPTRPAASW
jgi:hypothetical protein